MERENIDPIAEAKKAAKLRRSVVRTIDEFKRVVLNSLKTDSPGPLKESLRHDFTGVAAEPAAVIEPENSPVVIQVPIQSESVTIHRPLPEPETSVNMEAIINSADVQITAVFSAPSVRVFMAGIDNQVNSNIRNFLQKMGMQTFMPTALAGVNRHSILEDFNIHQRFDFAIVVLSPDEYVFQKVQDPQNALIVSKQETIFDLGFLVGKLGRGRVAVFYENLERFKRPTEFFDLAYIAYNADGRWQHDLLRQMKNCGVVTKEELPSPISS